MPENKVSVIVPTYNGAHKLPSILDRLSSLSDQFDELIVVIDGSTDATLEILETYKLLITKLKVIWQENQGRAVVRNTGAKAATGSLLIFFDDDMLPEPQCIQAHKLHHSEIQESLLTGGLSEFLSHSSKDIHHYRVWSREQWNLELKNSGLLKCTETNIGISAANFSISKSLFVKIGMFNEKLTDGEDFDLAYRAFKLGYPIYTSYNAFAWHDDEVSFKRFLYRTRECWQISKFLQKESPELYAEYFKGREQSLKSKKKYIYRLFADKFWIESIEQNRFSFLPKKWKYKLYDIVILANAAYFPNKVSIY